MSQIFMIFFCISVPFTAWNEANEDKLPHKEKNEDPFLQIALSSIYFLNFYLTHN